MECRYHDIDFINSEHYRYHLNQECEHMLFKRNICAHKLPSGIRCQKSFFTQTAMVLHCRDKHNLFICVECYQMCSTIDGLECHDHNIKTLCKV